MFLLFVIMFYHLLSFSSHLFLHVHHVSLFFYCFSLFFIMFYNFSIICIMLVSFSVPSVFSLFFIILAGVFSVRWIKYNPATPKLLKSWSENEVFLCAQKDAEVPRKHFLAEGLACFQKVRLSTCQSSQVCVMPTISPS